MTIQPLHRPGLMTSLILMFGALATGLPSAFAQASGDDLTSDEANTVKVVEEYGPSVVAIHITVGDVQMHPLMEPSEQKGGGSGFIIDEEGRIATNYHVVAAALEEGSTEIQSEASITVSFLEHADEEYPVRVRGAMPDFDLALLELVNREDLPTANPIPLGDSDNVRTGQKVIAIGTPFGLDSTVTTGIISAIGREQPGLVGIEIPFLQTDAAINPGNSGGPLLNSNAEVIGINNAILASPMSPGGIAGVGFAVPVNLLKESMEDLLAGGLSGVAAAVAELPERPRLGINAPVNVEDYPPPIREQMDFPEHGIVVVEVAPGGPADQAGLEGPTDAVMVGRQAIPVGGDIITAVDGQEVRRIIDLQQVLLEREAGDTVTLDVWRDGEERSVDVTIKVVPVEEKPAETRRQEG